MLTDENLIPLEKFIVKPGTKVDLRKFETEYTGEELGKKIATKIIQESRTKLSEFQDQLYAHNRFRILIVFQAMDAAGKDSAVKHVMSGFNPMGVKVYSFKAPNALELDHDYFWRHYLALPQRGEINIHNRSHYENVLVTRVHPEYILNERIPGIESVDQINDDFWKLRYEQINRLERNLYENGTVILKFFLNVSKKEQKKRFLQRIDDPSKNWKFSLGDLKERAHWDDYQRAYEDAITATTQTYAPWYILPADDKWYTRLIIASVLYRTFIDLNLSYPAVTKRQKAELEEARSILDKESDQ